MVIVVQKTYIFFETGCNLGGFTLLSVNQFTRDTFVRKSKDFFFQIATVKFSRRILHGQKGCSQYIGLEIFGYWEFRIVWTIIYVFIYKVNKLDRDISTKKIA